MKQKQGAPLNGRTLPKTTDDSDMYNRAFPFGNALFLFAGSVMSLFRLPYVTLKAMYYGSRYETKEFCKNCPHYPCHEGLYDIYVLGDGSIATCRWRRYGSMDTFEKDLERTIRIFRNAQYIGHNNIKKMERISEKGNDLL